MSKNRLYRILFVSLCSLFVLILMVVCLKPGAKDSGPVKHKFSEEAASREILFEDDRVFTPKDSFVEVSGSRVTITRGGTYTLKGELDDGQIIVDVGNEDEVKLKLNNVKISCSFGSPIYVKNAKKLRLRLKDGSKNELIQLETAGIGQKTDDTTEDVSEGNTGDKAEGDTGDKAEGNTEDKAEGSTEDKAEGNTEDIAEGNTADEAEGSTEDKAEGNTEDKTGSENTAEGNGGVAVDEDQAKGCIYARSDLTIKGDGILKVEGNYRHGIFSSKDLRIKGGNITVTAAKQALHGKKSVLITDGVLSLKAGTDGIHSNGSLEITGGQVRIDAGKYGMYAYTELFVDKVADVDVVHALSVAGCQGDMEY